MRFAILSLAASCSIFGAGARPAPVAQLRMPPLGPLNVVAPWSDLGLGLRHCSYVCSACIFEPGNQDFGWTLVPALNNASDGATFSLSSANFPTFHLSIVNTSSGAVGPSESPDADDASWTLTAPRAAVPANVTDAFTLVSASKSPLWAGKLLTATTLHNAPCVYASPAGDVALTDGAASGAARVTWILGMLPPAPPAPPAIIDVDVAAVINDNVSPKSMGCHLDYGFAQAPRGFLSNLVYGSSFEAGTQTVPGWTPYSRNSSDPAPKLTTYASFSGKPSTDFSLSGGGTATDNGLKNRGIGGAGLYLVGGQPYEWEVFIWAGDAPTAFIELYDFTNNVSLARTEVAVSTTGPDWGSTWVRYNGSLTPSASTACVGIPCGSDPTIDCGVEAGPAHVCVRCGGELRIGLTREAGDAKFGYVSLQPGPWGRLADKRGSSLPILKSAADVLTAMGVTLIRFGGSVSQSMRWKDWRGPVWARPSQQQVWGYSLLSGFGPFEYIEMAEALDIEPVVTLAYDTNDELDWADLVEYCWGDAVSTSWGKRRAADRGHPAPYNISVFELGNEQYSPVFVSQVLAMEERAKAVGAPPLHYAFPQNSGLRAADAARLAAAAPDVVTRILPDLHVGAGGAVEAAAQLFDQPPVPGFDQGAINAETNAGTHDLRRALDEAADLIDWFSADTRVTSRLYARTASFCSGSSNNFDQWDQGISFFLPNMTWFQPPGYVHVMVAQTWAPVTVSAAFAPGNASFPFLAGLTDGGKALILRAVNGAPGAQPATVSLAGAAAAGPSYALWTLGGAAFAVSDDNTPALPEKIAPVQQLVPIAAGATSLAFTLEPHTFAVMRIALQ